MADQDTLAVLAEEIAFSFGPLVAALGSPEAYRDFVAEFGWDFESVPAALEDLRDPVMNVWSMVEGRELPNDEVLELLAAENAAFSAIANLGDESTLPTDFRNEFPRLLVDYLLVDYLLDQRPGWGYALQILQLVTREEVPAQGSRTAYIRRALRVEDLGTFLSAPDEHLAERYRWGTSEFEGPQLLRAVYLWLEAIDFDVRTSLLSDETFAHLNSGALSPDLAFRSAIESVLLEVRNAPEIRTGVGLYLLPETPSQKPGFALLPASTIEFNQEFPLGLDLLAGFRARGTLAGGVSFQVRPGAVEAFVGVDSGNPAPLAIEFAVEVSRVGSPDPVVLLGARDGTGLRIEFGSFELGVRSLGSEIDIFSNFDLAGRISVAPSDDESDGFLAKLLPSNGVEVPFALSIGFSTVKGVQFGGSGGFEARIPVNLAVGLLEVRSVLVSVRFGDGSVLVALGVSAAATLGPVQVVLEDIGLASTFSFPPDKRGDLGVLDHSFSFKPPTGVGVSIDAGAIRGGGFLSLDHAAGRYSGALELSVFGIAVKAFGLIDTKFPDGREGFSFVIIIVAEFTPIQLGFGFTLIGVGGLLGVNRSVNEDGLATAVRTGSLEHLLFPRNPVRDAPAIVHDLGTVFPATRGHTILGPLGKLGWGTPTLISADIGIIIEFPGPRLGLLGVVRMALPSPDTALLRLQMAIGGLLDFPGQRMAMGASLYDSNVVGFAVTGDMAYRLNFGRNAKFLLSVGGFNPSFNAPPETPDLRRASVNLGVNGNPSLVASGYFAITSNTAQFGASIELNARGGPARLHGWMSYDALFVFSPFSFAVSFSAGMRVSVWGKGIGVTLRGDLSGPSPWHVKGKVCVSLLFKKACVSVDHKFGRREPAALPEMDPWVGTPPQTDPRIVVRGLQDAIQDPRSWSGSSPPAGFAVVSLAASAASDRSPIDPMGAATLRQRVAPLNVKLEKFGEYRPIVNDEFNLSSIVMNGQAIDDSELEVVDDDFAPAHFLNLSASERLTMESYVPMEAGFSIAPNRLDIGSVGSQVLEYETEFINDEGQASTNQPVFRLTDAQLRGLLQRSAAALGGIRISGTQRYVVVGRARKVSLGRSRFVVIDACTSVRSNGITPQGVSQVRALLALRAHVAANPADVGRYRVAPAHEEKQAA